jgi:Fes/CIP4, and EFC/F-BAR homology domain
MSGPDVSADATADASALRQLGLSKTEYAEALLPLPPLHVVEILRSRMKTARAINEEVAEFFRERIAIEENYVRSLQRLHRRPPILGMANMQYVPTSPLCEYFGLGINSLVGRTMRHGSKSNCILEGLHRHTHSCPGELARN